tara:strand:+ start:150 stop:731 length:582 start_codon:yes stop_codon:yes gene_type:complete
MKYIKQLENPLTDAYKDLKRLVTEEGGTDGSFPWYWHEKTVAGNDITPAFIANMFIRGHENRGYYTHTFLTRPISNQWYSKVNSTYIDLAQQVALDIFVHNKIEMKSIYRMSVNCEHPTKNNLPDFYHTDHDFPHHNMLVYLSDTEGGETLVDKERYAGKEDDVIIFDGHSIKHCNKPPTVGRRIVFIVTFQL